MKTFNRDLIFFVLKFIGLFCALYFCTLAIIGLSTPESYYSPFVAHYLDYVSVLRSSLLHASKGVLSLFNFQTAFRDRYTLMAAHGGIRMVYTCIGYGVLSFWAAFVLANKSSWKRKLLWLAGGLFALWCINVMRISLLIVALDKKWPMPLGLDHHTWFNIIAYALIFLMMYFYDRSAKTLQKKISRHPEVT
jgi:exosortase/archaeosortase family protein